jgi:hypothetical protein
MTGQGWNVGYIAFALVLMPDPRGTPLKDTRGASPSAECRITDKMRPLPEEIRETSGLARSLRDSNLFWTHNDSGAEPMLFTVSSRGAVTGRVRVTGAALTDWEDLDAGRCGGGTCLYVGDIGDNNAARASITVYRIPEPSSSASSTEPATVLEARFPDRPQDAEAFFVLPSGEMFLITKGRHGPIELYRLPAFGSPRGVPLTHVRTMGPKPANAADRVTGAAASPDGRWVAVRTYRTLKLYRAHDLVGHGQLAERSFDLVPLGEPKGESVVMGDDGSVWMTSEARGKRGLPSWSRLHCSLDERMR